MATTNAATTYLEHALIKHIFKNTAFTSPGDNIYVGLATAVSDAEAGSVTEANFGSYARQQVAAANWTVPSDASTDAQTATNTNNIEFPASTGTTETITHVIITDNATRGAGNILFVGALDSSRQIASGDIFRINATNLSIELK